jgi:Mg2+/citrate symporter
MRAAALFFIPRLESLHALIRVQIVGLAFVCIVALIMGKGEEPG